MIDLRDPSLSAETVRAALGLAPHPEGGAYREIWRDAPDGGGRGAATSILFLLAKGERSHWHRVDAAELWIWQAGAPLGLEIFSGNQKPPLRGAADDEAIHASACSSGGLPRAAGDDGREVRRVPLGPDLNAGETLQSVVPAHAWQAAESLGAWTLVSCVVAPAFEFSGFELAPPGWSPG
jgi:predicted cupin superfamily sugar epimerase